MKHLLQPLAMISLLMSFTACPGNSIVEGILSGAGIDGAVTQDTTGSATTDGTTNAESDSGEDGEDAAASSDSSDDWLEEYFSNDLDTTDYSGASSDDSAAADDSISYDASADYSGATTGDDSAAADDSIATTGSEAIPSDASADVNTGSDDAVVAATDDIPASDDAVTDVSGADTGSAADAEGATGDDTASTTGGDTTSRTGSGATDNNEADGGSDYQTPVDPWTGQVDVGAGFGKGDEDDMASARDPISGEVDCTEAERTQVSNTNSTHYMRMMPDNGRGRFMSMGMFEISFGLGRLGGGDGGDSGTAFDQFSGFGMALNRDSEALTKVGLTSAQVQLWGSATATDTDTGGLSGIATDFKGVYFGIQGEVEAPTCTVDLDGDGVGDKVISATGIYENLRVVGTQTADDGSETKSLTKVKSDGTFAIQGGMLASGGKFSYQIVNLQADTPESDDARITVRVQKGLQLDLTVGKGTSKDTSTDISTDTSDASDDTTLFMYFYPELSGKQFSKQTSALKGGFISKGKTMAGGTVTDSATDTATATDTAATDDADCKVCELQAGVKSSPTKVKTSDGEEGYGFLENKVLVLTK